MVHAERFRHRAGGRLRRPVRPADRAAGPRVPGVLGDRAGHDAASPRCWPAGPKAIILSGGPPRSTPQGAPPAPAGLLEAGVPGARDLLRLPADGVRAGRHGGAAPAPASTARPALSDDRRRAAGRAARRPARAPAGLDVTRRHVPPRRRPVSPSPQRTAATPVAAMEDPGPGSLRRAVPPRGAAHRARHGVLRRFLRPRAAARTGRCGPSSTSRSTGSAPQVGAASGDLRAVRRRRLGGRRRAGAAGHRRPADLRLRRPRAAAQGRGRAGRAGLRRRDRRGPARGGRRGGVPGRAGRRDATRRRSARSSGGSSSAPSSRPPARSPPRRARTASRSSSWSRARCTRTWSSPAAASGAANIKSHHNVGGLPDDLGFELVEPLRDAVQGRGAPGRRASSGCRREIVWRQPFPGPGPGASASSARSRRDRLRDPARGGRDRPRGAVRGRAGPRHLAVPGGAAGRRPLGRGPGRRPHLRPPGGAAPGDQRGRDDRRLGAAARRTCWPRSRPGSPTRCAEINRVVLDVTSKPPGHHRVGVAAPRAARPRESPGRRAGGWPPRRRRSGG